MIVASWNKIRVGLRTRIPVFIALALLGWIGGISLAMADPPGSAHHPKFVYTEGKNYSGLSDNWKGPRRLLDGLGANTPVSATDPGVAAMHGAVSSDGRWIAFTSSRKLTDGAVEGVANVYVLDAAHRGQADKPCCIELISVGNPKTEPTVCAISDTRTVDPSNGASYKPTISKDGRFVAFVSKATNLVSHKECRSGVAGPYVLEVPSVPGETTQIYLRDRQAGTTILVSSVLDSAKGIRMGGEGSSRSPSISGDGKYLAYSSTALGLVTVGQPTLISGEDIYFARLSDLATSRLSSIRKGTDEFDALLPSWEPVVNEDGRFIAFTTKVIFDTALDTNGVSDVVLYEHSLNVSLEPVLGSQASLRYVSRAPFSEGGRIGNAASGQPSITAKGERVAYTSVASNLADEFSGPPDTNNQSDVFVNDLAGQSQHRVSLGAPCCQYQLQGPSFQPAISGDGKRVMFTSLDPYVLYTLTDKDYLSEKRLTSASSYSCVDAVNNPAGGWPVHETDSVDDGFDWGPWPRTPDKVYPQDVVSNGCFPPVAPNDSLDMHVYLVDLIGTGTLVGGIAPVSLSDWRYRFTSYEQTDRRNIGLDPIAGKQFQEVTLARHAFLQADLGNAFSVVPGPQAMSYDGQTLVFDTAADNLQQADAAQANRDNDKVIRETRFWELISGGFSFSQLPSYGFSCLALATGYLDYCNLLLEDKNQAIDVYFFSPWNPYVYPIDYSVHMQAKVPPWARP